MLLDSTQELIHQQVTMLEAIYYLTTILGIPFIVGSFIVSMRRQRRADERNIFDTLDDVYVRFNEMLLQYPDLGVSEYDPGLRENLSTTQHVQQGHLFSILTAMFERAYLTYRAASNLQRKKQWGGWSRHMQIYAKKKIQKWWSNSKTEDSRLGFDLAF